LCLEVAVDAQLAHERRDLLDGGTVPSHRQRRARLAELRDEPAKAEIQDLRQVRGGLAGLAAPDAAGFEERHLRAGAGQEQRGRDAGDARADDRHVDLEVRSQ